MSSSSTNDERTPLLDPGDSNKVLRAPVLPDEEATITGAVADSDDPKLPNVAPDFSIIATLLLGVFINNADSTLVISQSGAITSEFNDFESAEWLVTAFFLSSCAAQPVLGKLSDIYGRKALLIISYVFFTVGNFMSGVGAAMWIVLLGRVVAGIGSGAGSSLVSILISDLVPIRSIAAWRSYVNVAATTGRSCGGPLGGILADTVGWRWSFYGQCPLTILAIVLVMIRLPSTEKDKVTPRADQSKWDAQVEKIRRIDFLGGFMMVAFTLTLLFGLEFASKNTSGMSTLSICLLAGAALFATAFTVVEEKFAKEPIFPVRLLLRRDVITTYLIGMFQMIAQTQLMFSVPLYFQIAMNASTSIAGTHLVPAVIGNALGGLLCGLIITRTGRYKMPTIGGLIFACMGYTLVIARWHGQTNWAESFYIFPGGFGTGVVQSTTFIALTAGVSKSDYAVAGSGLYQIMGIGGSMGSCITMTVLRAALQPLLRDGLGEMERKDEIISRAMADMYYPRSLHGPLREIVVDCYVKALTFTHVSSSVFSILSLLVSLFMKEHTI